MSELTPVRLPKVRDRLARFWATDAAPRLISATGSHEPIVVPGVDVDRPDQFQVVVAGELADVHPDTAANLCGRLHRGVAAADLFWVSGEFTDLAVAAGKDLPDLSLTMDELPPAAEERPARCGLIVWQKPISDINAAGMFAQVVAAGWVPVPGGIWITLYAQPEQVLPGRDIELLRNKFGYLMPVAPGAGLPFSRDLIPETARADRLFRTLLATFFLIRQPGMADVDERDVADKATRRRYGRERRQAPIVRVVNLRGYARPGDKPTDAEGRTYTVRWSVRGHWRNMAVGPGRTLRDRRYVRPHIKGPEGAPLKVHPDIEIVKTLR